MDVFSQIRHFTPMFITDTRWNPSNYVSHLKHDDIESILITLLPSYKTILAV